MRSLDTDGVGVDTQGSAGERRRICVVASKIGDEDDRLPHGGLRYRTSGMENPPSAPEQAPQADAPEDPLPTGTGRSGAFRSW